MHDSKIPQNIQGRNADIKKYVDKLNELLNGFDECKKEINIQEDETEPLKV